MAEVDKRAAARALGISRRRLRRIEDGGTDVPAEVIERALGAYGSDRFKLPDRQDLVRPDDPGVLRVGTERIPFDPVFDGNRTVLVRYLAAVRRQRGLNADDPVEFRASDLAALAGVLDLTADDLALELSSLAGLDTATARRSVRMLVLTGLCLLAVGGATLQTRTWFSPDPASAVPAAQVSVAAAVEVRDAPVPAAEISTAVVSADRSTDLVPVAPTWAIAPTDPARAMVSPFTVTASLPVEDVSPFSMETRRSPDGRDRTFHLFTVSA